MTSWEVIRMGSPIESGGLEIPEAWVQSVANALAWGILGWAVFVAIVLFLGMLAVTVRRRRFWCDQARREVEVEFEEQGLPGYRRPTAVLSCSVFEPPTAVQCRRACLDRDMRVRVPMARRLSWRKPCRPCSCRLPAASASVSYNKPGVTQAARQRDQNECLRAAISTDERARILTAYQIDREAYVRCLEARGYTARRG